MDNTNNKISGRFNSKPTWITLFILSLAALLSSLRALSLIKPKTCIVLCIAALILSFAGTFAGIYASKTRLEITDEFIYCKKLFGRELYLPIDSVTGIKTGFSGNICICAPSFRIRCTYVRNNHEIADAVRKRIQNR